MSPLAAPRIVATRKPSKRLVPLKDLSPGYRKRIRAYAKGHGLTVRQARAIPGAARGHKPAEHVTRKATAEAKAAALGILTPSQRQAVRLFAREQAGKIQVFVEAGNRDALVAPMLEWATREGFDKFVAMRSWQRGARRQFQQEQADGSYESRGEDFMELEAEDHDVPDFRWMFYHT